MNLQCLQRRLKNVEEQSEFGYDDNNSNVNVHTQTNIRSIDLDWANETNKIGKQKTKRDVKNSLSIHRTLISSDKNWLKYFVRHKEYK